jgi:hypothetical protein
MHPVEVLLLPVGWALRSRRPDEAASIANAPGLGCGNRIALTSPSFRDGQDIPAKHCGQFIGDEISPALTTRAPYLASTRSPRSRRPKADCRKGP